MADEGILVIETVGVGIDVAEKVTVTVGVMVPSSARFLREPAAEFVLLVGNGSVELWCPGYPLWGVAL
jgi:hypothetical protein